MSTLGAAWAFESINTIVNCWPFSLSMEIGGESIPLYEAYTPSVQFRPLTSQMGVVTYENP
jgi:hypothetical protein